MGAPGVSCVPRQLSRPLFDAVRSRREGRPHHDLLLLRRQRYVSDERHIAGVQAWLPMTNCRFWIGRDSSNVGDGDHRCPEPF
jgi:hypothetical protein